MARRFAGRCRKGCVKAIKDNSRRVALRGSDGGRDSPGSVGRMGRFQLGHSAVRQNELRRRTVRAGNLRVRHSAGWGLRRGQATPALHRNRKLSGLWTGCTGYGVRYRSVALRRGSLCCPFCCSAEQDRTPYIRTGGGRRSPSTFRYERGLKHRATLALPRFSRGHFRRFLSS